MAWARANPLMGFWYKMSMNPPAAEQSIEPAIAALGMRYRHQYPFLGIKYFADFALLDEKIIIEVDGDSHDNPAQKEKDLLHALEVLKLGWIVVRVTNAEALSFPGRAVKAALAQARSLDKALVETQLMEELDSLYQSYPHLLAEAAKHAKSRSQSGLKGANRRRSRATADHARK